MPDPEEEPEHVQTIQPDPIPPKPKQPPTWTIDGETFSWQFSPEQVEDLRTTKAFFEDLFDKSITLKEAAYWMHAYPGGLHTWRMDQVCSAVFAAFEAGPDNPVAFINTGCQSKTPYLIPDPFSEPDYSPEFEASVHPGASEGVRGNIGQEEV